MWVKVDDKMPEHPKVIAAGARLGRYGCGRVLAIWHVCAAWTNRNETDGVVPLAVLREFRLYDRAPLQVAAAMAEPVVIAGETRSGLLERLEDGSGYRLHDHGEYQPTRAQQQAKRDETRLRVQDWRARQAADQAGGCNAECNAVTSVGVTLLVTPPPIPDPIPIPKPQERESARARDVVFRGARLRVTAGQHAYLAALANEVDVDWPALYARVDAELVAHGEPFRLLDTCEAALATALGIRKPATPTEADYHEATRIYRQVSMGCRHDPSCPDRETCIATTARRVMLHRIAPHQAVRA